MTKEQIIEALKYHDVPESNEDMDPYEWMINLDNAFNYKPNAKAKTIELSYECSYSNMDEYVDDLTFNVYNKIGGRSIYTQIATGEELSRASHEDLADKLLELETFASGLRVLTTERLDHVLGMTKTLHTTLLCANDTDNARNVEIMMEEIMSVKM